ncbi:MAG: hypothetical protein QOI71_906, partial [Gaiellales bacterium]|nr:hypothetical protein [Gaiellales bacterium]
AGSKFDPHVVQAFARLDHAALVQPAAQPGLLAAVTAEPARRTASGTDSQAA